MISKVQLGNNIVADENLIFYTDAYSGGGSNGVSNFNYYSPTTTQSVWYDLSNNKGDIQATGFFYTSSDNGYFIFTGSLGTGSGQSNAFSSITPSSVLTIEIFFNSPVQTTSTSILFSGGQDFSNSSCSFWVGLTDATGGSRIIIGNSDTVVVANQQFLTPVFPISTWNCATLVIGPFGTTPLLYGNGGPISSSASFTSVPTSSLGNYIFLARKAGGNNRPLIYPVKVGSIKVWNRALSSGEIAQSYNNTKGRYGL